MSLSEAASLEHSALLQIILVWSSLCPSVSIFCGLLLLDTSKTSLGSMRSVAVVCSAQSRAGKRR